MQKDGKKKVIKIQYEQLSALHAEQFVVNRTDECFLLGFSTGVVDDVATGAKLLSVHSRVALSEMSVKKLIAVLQDALRQTDTGREDGARIPSIEGSG